MRILLHWLEQLRIFRVLMALALAFFVGFVSGCSTSNLGGAVGGSDQVAYFAFKDVNPKEVFIIKLTAPDRIREARAILSGKQRDRTHVSGIIVKGKAEYNPDWSYYMAPESIGFFQMATEGCDSTMRHVEDHLNEVGGAFLPGNRWCPWQSKLVRETPVVRQ